jgi:hypothetical protein
MKKTLTDYIRSIVSRSQQLNNKSINAQASWRPAASLAKLMKLTKEEALLFSHAYYLTLTKKSFSPQDMRESLSDDPFDLPGIIQLLNGLFKKKLLIKSSEIFCEEYQVSKTTLLEIDNNKVPSIKINDDIRDILTISDEMSVLIHMRYDHLIDLDDFYSELDTLLELHPDYEPFVFLKKQGIQQSEWLIFIITFIALLEGEASASVEKMLKRVFRGTHVQFEYRTLLQQEQTQLQQKKLIAFGGDELSDGNELIIPEGILRELLGIKYEVIESQQKSKTNREDLMQPEKIQERTLYYNPSEKNEINTLHDLLVPSEFIKIQENLKTAGYKSGFCVLLHGTPGTGKTETVLQLAKMTGRAILKVDIASIRDKFVGETEKNISEVFKRYKKIVKHSEITPILLFNEADALFNTRMTVRQSVDQMNNAMQNILLEELENFEGILFATTNLAPNMDAAFERRFLYKIKFTAPSDEARCAIWQTHFPQLEQDAIANISNTYNLSGGQIENVAKKATLQAILYNKPISEEMLKELCSQESISDSSNRKQIGFKND